MTLFDPGPGAPAPKTQSYGSRLTARNAGVIAGGRNPATMRPLLLGGGTCGDCSHLKAVGGTARNYWKCELACRAVTGGAATDVRLSWPACELFTTTPLEPTP